MSLRSPVGASEGHSNTQFVYSQVPYSFYLVGFATQQSEPVYFYSHVQALLIYLFPSCDVIAPCSFGLACLPDQS
jgi:hypothetical protein